MGLNSHSLSCVALHVKIIQKLLNAFNVKKSALKNGFSTQIIACHYPPNQFQLTLRTGSKNIFNFNHIIIIINNNNNNINNNNVINMDLFWILVALLSLSNGQTSAQSDEWNIQNLDQDSNMDNLFRYFYSNNNGTLDLGKMNLTELQDNIHEKMATLNLSGKDLDVLFNFNDVAITPLGQLTAWVGDRFYPVIIYGVIFGAAAVLIYAIFLVIVTFFCVWGWGVLS